jgi:hypothetical protein
MWGKLCSGGATGVEEKSREAAPAVIGVWTDEMLDTVAVESLTPVSGEGCASARRRDGPEVTAAVESGKLRRGYARCGCGLNTGAAAPPSAPTRCTVTPVVSHALVAAVMLFCCRGVDTIPCTAGTFGTAALHSSCSGSSVLCCRKAEADGAAPTVAVPRRWCLADAPWPNPVSLCRAPPRGSAHLSMLGVVAAHHRLRFRVSSSWWSGGGGGNELLT